jgi:hypothetical protein
MHLTSSAQPRLCDQRCGLHCEVTRKRPCVCTSERLRCYPSPSITSTKLSGQLPSPNCRTASEKNLNVLTVDQNPESLLCPSRCSATLSAKEMPLTKHLIYRDSKSYFLANFVRKLDTNTKSNHPLLNHWLDSRISRRKCNVSCHFFINHQTPGDVMTDRYHSPPI